MVDSDDDRSCLDPLCDPVDIRVPSDRLRVVLVDDSAPTLAVVTRILQPEFMVAGTYLDGESLLRQLSAVEPDIVVLDISIGATCGFDVARQLVHWKKNVKMVFLSVHEDLDFVAAGLGIGASGFVFKSRLAQDLIPALQAASSGRLFVSFNAVETG